MNAVAHRKSPQLRPMHEYDLEAVAQIEQQNYAFPWTFGIFRDCVRAGYGCLGSEVAPHGIQRDPRQGQASWAATRCSPA